MRLINLHSHLIHDKSDTEMQGQRCSLQQMVLGQVHMHIWENNGSGPLPIPIHKNLFQVNCKSKSENWNMSFWKLYIEKHLQDLGKISYITALKIKGKNMEYIGLYRILKFCFTKDINTSRRKIIKPRERRYLWYTYIWQIYSYIYIYEKLLSSYIKHSQLEKGR